MSPISELLASLPRARNFAEFVMADRFYHNVGVVIHCGLTRIEQLRGHTNLLVLMDAINADKARREDMHSTISKSLIATTAAMEENVYSKGKTTGPVPMFVHSY